MFEMKKTTGEDESETNEINEAIEAERRNGIGSKNCLKQNVKQQIKISFKDSSEIKPGGEGSPKKEFEKQLEQNSKAKDMHPKGLRKQLREAETIEEAIETLLAASNEEKQIRTKIRNAATIEEALESMMPEKPQQEGTVFHAIDSDTENEQDEAFADFEFEALFDFQNETVQGNQKIKKEMRKEKPRRTKLKKIQP